MSSLIEQGRRHIKYVDSTGTPDVKYWSLPPQFLGNKARTKRDLFTFSQRVGHKLMTRTLNLYLKLAPAVDGVVINSIEAKKSQASAATPTWTIMVETSKVKSMSAAWPIIDLLHQSMVQQG